MILRRNIPLRVQKMRSSSSNPLEGIAKSLMAKELMQMTQQWKKECEENEETIKLPVTREEFLVWGTWILMLHLSSLSNSRYPTLEEYTEPGMTSELLRSLKESLDSQTPRSAGTTPCSTIPSSEGT